MLNLTRVIDTFPSIKIPSESGGLPIEVSLIAQLGHGAGNHLLASVAGRQQKHSNFIDELDEPSAKLGVSDFEKGDPSSLYSFIVGPKGHPFHCHAGNRMFTAVSGSGGAQLRFSTASSQQMAENPQNFIHALRFINIPPDCMFTVRFGGETWHQFYPLTRNSTHPVLFALSCHTNELGGNLSVTLKDKVLANEASIPTLTELLPPAVLALLEDKSFREESIPTTTLALDAPAGTLHRVVCNTVRSNAGTIRGAWGTWINSSGFQTFAGSEHIVEESHILPESSLLKRHLADKKLNHEDTFRLTVTDVNLGDVQATEVLQSVLDGFLQNAPKGVSRLMAVRNMLVKPLGLRTSTLGCPVSSLLSENDPLLFAGRFPVLDQSTDEADTHAQVVLGADDKHLMFRSCVGVRIVNGQSLEVSLENRVHCKNLFGRFYMTSIDLVHRNYIAPTMLRRAVDYAIMQRAWSDLNPV